MVQPALSVWAPLCLDGNHLCSCFILRVMPLCPLHPSPPSVQIPPLSGGPGQTSQNLLGPLKHTLPSLSSHCMSGPVYSLCSDWTRAFTIMGSNNSELSQHCHLQAVGAWAGQQFKPQFPHLSNRCLLLGITWWCSEMQSSCVKRWTWT